MKQHSDNFNQIAAISSRAAELSALMEKLSRSSAVVSIAAERQRSIFSKIPNFDYLNIWKNNLNHLKWSVPNLNVPSFDLFNSKLIDSLKNVSKIGERLKNSPELQFLFISDLELLNLQSSKEFKDSLTHDLADEDIKDKENVLNVNLLPYLKKINIDTLWIGASEVLEIKSNPDRLRHCLISLRTILEFLIDERLAPIGELKNSTMFESEFRKYHNGKKPLEFVKIKRYKKIEYFASKVNLGFLEEFTKNEIQYICDCYSVLCNIHRPDIGMTENQVRSLKVKTGITIWLLAYIDEVIRN